MLYLAAMGIGLGDLVEQHSGTVDGLTYLEFVAPGLLVASAMQLAAGESHVAGARRREVDRGTSTAWSRRRSTAGRAARRLRPVDRAPHDARRGPRSCFVAALLGAVPSAWGVLAIPAAGLCAAAFCAPLAAYSVMLDTDLSFPLIMRLGVLPLFLFSGTFFPIIQLPDGLQPIAQLSPLWHGVELARAATTGTFDPRSRSRARRGARRLHRRRTASSGPAPLQRRLTT